MKTLYSCFLMPVYLAAALSGLGGLLIYLDASGMRPVENTHRFLSNMYFCVLHFTMAASLTIAILTFIYCACMAVFGFIIKNWLGVIISIAGGILMFFLAQFLLNTSI